MTVQFNSVLVLLIKERTCYLVRNITCSTKLMSLRSFRIPTLVVTISIIALVGYHRKAQRNTPSPAGVRVTSQMLEEARLTAMKNDKVLMVRFGASWCPDCLELSKSLNDVITSNRLEQHFVVVNVDVGEFNRNLNVARSLGVDVNQGIPVAVFFPPHSDASSVKLGTEQILGYVKEVTARP